MTRASLLEQFMVLLEAFHDKTFSVNTKHHLLGKLDFTMHLSMLPLFASWIDEPD
jgi:hypothetical protein